MASCFPRQTTEITSPEFGLDLWRRLADPFSQSRTNDTGLNTDFNVLNIYQYNLED